VMMTMKEVSTTPETDQPQETGCQHYFLNAILLDSRVVAWTKAYNPIFAILLFA
jgi:hypothetical protein